MPAHGGILLVSGPATIVPGVHLLGGTHPNAAYAIETTDGIVLVDTCRQADAGPILEQLKALGLDPARLRAILLTHAHADHVLGAERLRSLTGAQIHAGKGDAAVLRAGAPREAFVSVFAMEEVVHPTTVDRELSGGEVLRVGECAFEVLATPGHTPGSMCYLLRKDGLRILFTGDALMSLTDTAPLTGPGIYSAALSPRFRGDASAFRDSLVMLSSMEPPDMVLPGHPRADPRPEDPRVPKWWWRTLLENGITRLDRIRDRLETDGPDFLDTTVREILPGLRSLGVRGGVNAYTITVPSGVCLLVNAPGDPGFLERLSSTLGSRGLRAGSIFAVLITSGEARAWAGVPALVAATGCTVFAPAVLRDEILAACPPGTTVREVSEFADASPFPVQVRTCDGSSPASVAMRFEWTGGRVVLLTGCLPDPATVEPDGGDPVWDGPVPSNATAALMHLEALARPAPHVWLPLRPINDQNANLYDAEWSRVLRHNRAFLEPRVR
jgi:glyoxylase-like metal-dependent hydrolase (beta-lactamase superfamily II)